jgi:hypothetical protein
MKGDLQDQSVFIGIPSSYTIPMIEDEEGLKIRAEPDRPIPSFVVYEASSRTFKLIPTKKSELGSYIINYCYKDDFSSQVCDKLKVTVLDPSEEGIIQKRLKARNNTLQLTSGKMKVYYCKLVAP